MPRFVRPAVCLSALLILANCAAAPAPPMASRSAPAQPPASRAVGDRDLACLAEAIYFEARGTGETGEAAVAHVVVNRSRSSKFPSSVCGVVGQGCQFSYRCDGQPDALAEPSAAPAPSASPRRSCRVPRT